jgi:hypothetical protein
VNIVTAEIRDIPIYEEPAADEVELTAEQAGMLRDMSIGERLAWLRDRGKDRSGGHVGQQAKAVAKRRRRKARKRALRA